MSGIIDLPKFNYEDLEEICPNSHTGQEKSITASRSKI